MISYDVHCLLDSVWQQLSTHPYGTVFLVIIVYAIYKIHFFTEIVLDFKDEVPKSVRILPEQKLPPCYPNGWIPILESRSIKLNEVKSVVCFGQELAVIRGNKGHVYVTDAYCPHLGANLAVGGTVHRDECDQDCIRCPFHGWSFRMTDGHCANVPYQDSTSGAKVKIWSSIEMNKVIFVWYHADHQEPKWYPEEAMEIAKNQWKYQGRTEHFVNCHIQEIPENGADIAHLGEIHEDPFIFGSNSNPFHKLNTCLNILKHEWSAQWTPCAAPNEHSASIEIVNRNKLFGFTIFDVILKVNQVGPAYVELRFESNFLGGVKGTFLQLVKPIGPLRNSIIHQIYTEKTLTGYIFGKFLILAEAKMLERDIRIWNRKAFLRKPYLARSEKAIVKYRRWFSQFYSESSKQMIDW